MPYFDKVPYSGLLPEKEQNRRREAAEYAVGSAGLEGVLSDNDDIDDIDVLSRYIRGETTLEEVDPDFSSKAFRKLA